MTLRARKPGPAGQGTSSSPDRKKAYHQSHPVGEAAASTDNADASSSPSSPPESIAPAAAAKKLPRVILKVGPRPET
jgi:histone deacetylase HOS3